MCVLFEHEADTSCEDRGADFGNVEQIVPCRLVGVLQGTQPCIAPEIFTDKLYTAAVDLWAHGVVVAWLLSPGKPPGYRGDEGVRWCAAVVQHQKPAIAMPACTY